MLTLSTPRLRLVAFDPSLARVALDDRDAFRQAVGALVPHDWPTGPVRDRLAAHADRPHAEPGWGPWVIVDASARVVVGDAGFKGGPDSVGVVEIGYGIVPAHRNRGHATQAVLELSRWALTQPRVRRVTAETVRNVGSDRVLEKAGFVRFGERAGATLWALSELPAPEAETP